MEVQRIILSSSQLAIGEPIILTFSLNSNNVLSGTYTMFDDGKTLTEKNTDYIVTGNGTSKLVDLLEFTEFKDVEITDYKQLIGYLNVELKLSDGDEYGRITGIDNTSISYTVNIHSASPINYVDFSSGKTIFTYNRKTDDRIENPPYFIVYEGIQEEPKILSDIFIERGVVSGLDGFKRLKQIKSLNELIKYGNGYYNVTTKATDIITK